METKHEPKSVQIWCHKNQEWKDIEVDVHPINRHLNTGWTNSSHRVVFPYPLTPNQVGYVRISERKFGAEEVEKHTPKSEPIFDFELKDNRIHFT
mmetsp:Transcript_2490/g.3841  ORF Transcript_2490/g.3841 Transcript_2490/m.3841 type:complete len:95 (+) Transcript_2490:1483-1767(+)